jgi:hypothetical protein
VLFVELEFSTLENLPVKKLKLETKEDNFYLLPYKNPNPDKISVLGFFLTKNKVNNYTIRNFVHRFYDFRKSIDIVNNVNKIEKPFIIFAKQ